ncbi:T9SS type A sorting domain-containing protein [Dyadobacter psychrotolerans]|uniref:T9SS type A sorting domain-containing protein n=1 Tax=Dyadobacter psychrotolerans TaxID=2541721 RepID=A0A4R5DKF9_9BACT|nr:T9SS type A sorting domain-containing protein [Dyadobacter psychrotolerans]TDE11325.1 T9SS type A sorting domain-containing protein [Dyadobacter psychrotolerans]
MTNFINRLKHGTKYLRVAAISAMALSAQSSFAQKTFLTGQKTGDRFDVGGLGLVPGGANVSAPFEDHTTITGFKFYYGANILNSDAVTIPATLTATNELSALVKISGANVYAQFRNTSNANILADKVTYFKLKDKPVTTGIGVSVGGLLGLTEFNNIVGQGYVNAGNYSTSGAGNINEGTPAGTATTKLLIDKLGEYYVAVKPNADYNSVRLSVSIPNDIVQAASTFQVKVYNAFTEADGSECSSKPRYADAGSASGITLATGALRLLSLNDLVNNPKGAIDDSPTTYSAFSSGIANIGVASTTSQNFFFDRTASGASESVKISLGVSGAAIDLGLVAGEISFQAYKGEDPVGAPQTLANSLSLLNLNLLDIVTVGTGAEAYKNVTVPINPTGDFDRIQVSLSSLVSAGVLGDALRIYDVSIAPKAPTLSAVTEYIFTGTQPLTIASTAATGNKITWIGPLPATTVVGTAASASTYRFPTTLTANGDYAAVATRGSCTVQSTETKLKVIVLTDATVLAPGISQSPFPSGSSITATTTGTGHAFTYVGTTVPSFVTVNSAGAIVANGSTPTVTTPTNYPVTVEIHDNGVNTGLTLTKQIIVNPKLGIPGGPFPATDKNTASYSADISTMVSARAFGGKGSGFYSYSLTPITIGGRGAATLAVPADFTLTPQGVLSGSPLNKEGSYTFPVYVTDGQQVASADFTLEILASLPVKLTSFTVKKEGTAASLSWATTAETNSESFDVERSGNGKEWKKIANVLSKGESIVTERYSLTDTSPFDGENLYRLKMIDQDGTFAYSRVETVNFSLEGLKLYPNPVVNSENLNIGVSDWSKVKSVKILNSFGVNVFESAGSLDAGVKTNQLGSGLYVVQVIQKDGRVLTHKFVKL